MRRSWRSLLDSLLFQLGFGFESFLDLMIHNITLAVLNERRTCPKMRRSWQFVGFIVGSREQG